MSASEIAAANKSFETYFAAGELDKLMTLYTEEACFLPPNMDLLRGRDAIKAFFKGARDMGIAQLKLVTIEVDAHGDHATEMGTYELLTDSGAVADHGKFLVAWKKDGDQWRLHRDMINSSMPPPE